MYGAWGLSQPHCWGQSPHSAAAAISHAAITTPIPVFIAAATTRPISAPVATRVAVPAVASRRVYSATSAPANEPTNAPITEPTMGTGTPTIAPTMPPMIAPHPARREPPYFRVYRDDSVNSKTSAITARTAVATIVTQPIGSPPTSASYPIADPIMIHVPGRPSGMRNSETSSTAAKRSTSMAKSVLAVRLDQRHDQARHLDDPRATEVIRAIPRRVDAG